MILFRFGRALKNILNNHFVSVLVGDIKYIILDFFGVKFNHIIQNQSYTKKCTYILRKVRKIVLKIFIFCVLEEKNINVQPPLNQ